MKFALTVPGTNTTPFQIQAPSSVPTGGLTTGFEKTMQLAIEVLFIVAIILALWFIIWAGVRMIIFGGKKDEISKSRGILGDVVFGLTIVFLAFLAIRVIGYFFDIPILP